MKQKKIDTCRVSHQSNEVKKISESFLRERKKMIVTKKVSCQNESCSLRSPARYARLLAFLLVNSLQSPLQPVALDSLGDVNKTGYVPLGIVFTPNGNALGETAINATTGLPGFLTYQFNNGSMTGAPLGGFATANNTSLVSAAGAPCNNALRWLPNTTMAAALFMLNSSSPSSGTLNLNTFNCPSIANGSNATSAPILGNVNASFLNGNLSANCCMDVSADGQYMAITDTVYDGNALSSTLYVLSQEGTILALAALGNTLPGSISISPVSSAGTYYITVGGLDSTLRAFSFTANTVGALNSLGTVTTTGGPFSIAWHPSGLYLAVGTNTPGIQVYTFNGTSAPVALGSQFTGGSPALVATIGAMVWAPNGTYIASVDGTTGTILRVLSFTGSTPALAQVGSTVTLAGPVTQFTNSVTWSPNSSFIAAATTLPALQVFSFNGTSTPVRVGSNLTAGLNNPVTISWSPNGNYLAVGSSSNGGIQLFTFSSSTTPTIAASGNPLLTNMAGLFSVTWSPNGNYLAAVDSTNSILQVYAFSGGTFTQIGGNVSTGTTPERVSWSPNGNYITVTNTGANTIQTYSFNGYSTPTPIAAGTTSTGASTSPRSGIWSPSGNYFAVINNTGGTLQAFSWPYNTPTRIGTSLPTGTSPQSVTWSPNGNYLATVATNGGTNQLQAWSFSTTSTPTAALLGSAVTTGAGPESVAFSPNGNYLAVANTTANTLQVFSFAAGTPALVGSVSIGASTGPISVAWSPNGNYITVVNETSNMLQVYAFSGSGPVLVGSSVSTGASSQPSSVSWSPNGNYIAVVNLGTNNLQVYSFSGSTPVQIGSSVITGATSQPGSVAWSPNGNYIAVANTSLSTLQLQVYSFSGSTPVLLGAGTTTNSGPISVAWSPNGNYLVVANDTSSNLTVYYFDGTDTPVLVSTITTGTNPKSVVWSPNGQFIAAVNQGSNSLQLFYAPIFQSGQPLLNQLGNTVSTANPVTSVAFSPNGNYIATAGSGIQLYSFNNAFSYLTTNTTAITLRGSAVATSAISRQVVWSPTNNYLATVLDNATLNVLSFNPSAPTTPSVVATANTMPLPTMCAWSPQGNAYAGNYIVTASPNNGGGRRLFYFDPFSSTNFYA